LGLVTSSHLLEEALGDLPLSQALLRAAWFFENSAGDVASARNEGKVRFQLHPLDRKFPLVATADIGKVGAEMLTQSWTGISLVEELASTVWRQRRLVAIETRMFNDAAAKRPEQTQVGRITGAFSDLSRGTEMRLLDRYESRLHRMVQRTLKNIQLLRQLEPSDDASGELTKLPWDSKNTRVTKRT
jgi:hypothetical protein